MTRNAERVQVPTDRQNAPQRTAQHDSASDRTKSQADSDKTDTRHAHTPPGALRRRRKCTATDTRRDTRRNGATTRKTAAKSAKIIYQKNFFDEILKIFTYNLIFNKICKNKGTKHEKNALGGAAVFHRKKSVGIWPFLLARIFSAEKTHKKYMPRCIEKYSPKLRK